MDTLTLFHAYELARDRKSNYRSARGDRSGIAVATDRFARGWQRFDRLEVKLFIRITHRLGGEHFIDKNGGSECPICGFPWELSYGPCPRHDRYRVTLEADANPSR